MCRTNKAIKYLSYVVVTLVMVVALGDVLVMVVDFGVVAVMVVALGMVVVMVVTLGVVLVVMVALVVVVTCQHGSTSHADLVSLFIS